MLIADPTKRCCVTRKYVAEDGPNGCCKSRVLGVSWADDCSADDAEICGFDEFSDSWGGPIPNSVSKLLEAVVHAR